MSLRVKISATLLVAVATLHAIDKDKTKFQPGAAASYENKQTIAGVTIAAQPFASEEQVRAAFGKVNFEKFGVLPVLIVIQNDTKQPVRLDEMKVEYLTARRDRIEATPPEDVAFLDGTPGRPGPIVLPPIPRKRGWKALDDPVIQERAFKAKMVPPADSAWGFVYFRTAHRSGSQAYITGLKEAQTGNDIFFFEVPLDGR